MIEGAHGGDIYRRRSLPQGKRLLDFSANTNFLGMPEEVCRAIVDNMDQYCAYPDPFCRELREALSLHHGIPEEHFYCGNGAADLIFRMALAVSPPVALVTAPAFSEYEQALRLAGAHVRHHMLDPKKEYVPDHTLLDAVDSSTRMVFLCNPNNPTGVAVPREQVLGLAAACRKNNTLLVVDECFIDFLEEPDKYSVEDSTGEYPNLVILKAFTKIYAMAGLRLGYMICSDRSLLERVAGAGQPWTVSTVAAKAGVAALGCRDYVKRSRTLVLENRKELERGLRELGFIVIPSQANYLIFQSGDSELDRKLEAQGILIRNCTTFRNIPRGYFRIAVRSAEDNRILLEELKKHSGQRSPGEMDVQ